MLLLAAIFCAAACSDDPVQGPEPVTVESLARNYNTELAALQTLLSAQRGGVCVSGVDEAGGCRTVRLDDGRNAVIYEPKTAAAPAVGFKLVGDAFCWTLDGQTEVGSGDTAVPVSLSGGKAPAVEADNGLWRVTFDGRRWLPAGTASDAGGTSLFESVRTDASFVTFTLRTGDVFSLPLAGRQPLVFKTFVISSAVNAQLVENIRFADNGQFRLSRTLPYHVDRNSLAVAFSVADGCRVTVGGVEQRSGVTRNDFREPVQYRITDSEGRSQVYTVTLECDYSDFTGLPVVFIDTGDDSDITSKEDWKPATMSIKGNDRLDDFPASDISIRGRGNSTWDYPKKPYAIKLDKKAPVLGMPEHKRWVLLANYNDLTLVRTALAFFMGREYTGLRWKQGGEPVEVVLNGRHLGSYYLCEQVKIDRNRVADGYLIEVDSKASWDDITFVSDVSGLTFNIKDPDVDRGGSEYFAVKSRIDRAERDLRMRDRDSYRGYMHLDSFADWYLNSEISKNSDACFHTSVYMNLAADNTLYMGPLWDYDIAFGNDPFGNHDNSPREFWIRDHDRSGLWLSALFDDDEFIALLKSRYAVISSRRGEIMDYIDRSCAEMRRSVYFNDRIWHRLAGRGASRSEILAAYDREVARLKNWLGERFEWLDRNVPAL